MIHLVSGATEGYPWTEAYWQSVHRHMPPIKNLLNFDGDTMMLDGHIARTRMFRITDLLMFENDIERPKNRCKSLQAGEFLKRLRPLEDRDIIIFTDADMVMQRPFERREIEEFVFCTEPDTVWLAVNGEPGDTLRHEAELLEPDVEDWIVDKLFPGWREIPVWNCGVIVARAATYARLRDMALALMPAAETCFRHYAVIQWVICYCVGRWLKHALLPRTIHAHGHFGLPKDCGWDETGDVIVRSAECGVRSEEGVKAVFRHALNLTPPKGARPPAKVI